MPRKTDLQNFPAEYEQLLLRAEQALRTGKEFAVQFDSPNVAAGIRHRAYSFLSSLRKSSARPDLTAACADLSMRVAGSALVFFRRQDSVDAVALRRALQLPEGFADAGGAAGVIVPDNGLSSSLEKLAEIRSRK